jgi:cytochrome c peroxidase
MHRTRILPAVLAGALLAAVAGCATTGSQPSATTPQPGKGPVQAAANPHMGTTYSLLAFTATGSMGNPYNGQLLFNNAVSKAFPGALTSNNRSCASCHVAGDAFGLAAKTANARPASDPLIAALLADGDPDVDFATPEGQKLEAIMLDQLRKVGFIRIVLPNPNYDAAMGPSDDNPPFIKTFRSVPTVFNSALGPFDSFDTSAGGTFKAFTMWDGREISLERQAGSATIGHAQTVLTNNPTGDVRAFLDAKKVTNDIAAFEKKMLSMPQSLATIGWEMPVRNTALDGTIYEGAPKFTLATVKDKFFKTVNLTTEAQKRGMRVFTGTPQKPACIVCHNMPETLAGGTELFEDARISEENTHPRLQAPDAYTREIMEEFGFTFLGDGTVQKLPVQKLRLKKSDGSYETVYTPDPGLAGQTGMYDDLHKFKTSQLRGIKNANRFFHDNHERELSGVVHHYMQQFPELFPFTPSEENDLLEFLKAL